MKTLSDFFTPEQRQRFAELSPETRQKLASILAKRAVLRLNPEQVPDIFAPAPPPAGQ